MVLTSKRLVSGQVTRRTCPRLAVALLGAIIVFSTPLPGWTQSPPRACRLVSRAEVERALQAPVGEGEIRVNTENLTSCTFAVAGGGSVSILLRRHASKEWIDEQTHRMSNASSFQPVSAGDSAFVLDMRHAGTVFCVFQGEYCVVVSVNRVVHGDGALQAAQCLARIALSKL
jgi:hypothetical protein